MKLLTPELLERFREIGRQEEAKDPLVIAKFFRPDAGWTWYATEYDEAEEMFFGLVVGFEAELGYFSLAELESARGGLGLPVERDLYFSERPLSQVRK
jgi:hypothetical protein